jgi:hypothetical protein
MEKEEKRKPDYDVRLKGVRLAVWKNQTDGRTWFSAAPSRRSVENGGKEAKYYTTFNGVADLVLLREEINQAISWMTAQEDQVEEE